MSDDATIERLTEELNAATGQVYFTEGERDAEEDRADLAEAERDRLRAERDALQTALIEALEWVEEQGWWLRPDLAETIRAALEASK